MWNQAGQQENAWQIVTLALPAEVQALRFVGVTPVSAEMALDGINISDGIPATDFGALSCTFETSWCAWFTANTWQRVTGMDDKSLPLAHDGDWNLQVAATANASETEAFVLESWPFNLTQEMVLTFSYKMSGSQTVLEVERRTLDSDWASLASFFVKGSKDSADSAWQQQALKVPSGTTALRMVASVNASFEDRIDLVALDSFVAGLAAFEDLRGFEAEGNVAGFEVKAEACEWTMQLSNSTGDFGSLMGLEHSHGPYSTAQAPGISV